MKKFMTLFLALTTTAMLLTGCSGIEPKSNEDFNTYATDAGYETTEMAGDLYTGYNYTTSDGIYVEFAEFDTAANAKLTWQTNATTLDSANPKVTTNVGSTSKFTGTIEDTYYAVIRSENTLMTVVAPVGSKEAANAIIEEFGY